MDFFLLKTVTYFLAILFFQREVCVKIQSADHLNNNTKASLSNKRKDSKLILVREFNELRSFNFLNYSLKGHLMVNQMHQANL